MKILQVVHQFLPNYSTGTENYTYDLAKSFVKNHKDKVYIFTTEPDSKIKQIKYYKKDKIQIIKVYKKKKAFTLKQAYIDYRMEEIFKELVERIKPDIVLFQHFLNHSLGYYKILETKKIPYIFFVHDYWFMCPNIRAMKNNYQNCEILNLSRCRGCAGSYLNKRIPFAAKVIQYLFWNKNQLKKRIREIEKMLQKAKKIIVFSNFSKKMLTRNLKVNPKKIKIVAHGIKDFQE
ncbi:MAG: glycosyltransferase [Candidatus Moranbacteria bacterium]|nr:glycosyltransferase [Candidatus Moranbacteria bacterium]